MAQTAEMTPRERVAAAANLQPVDRVPVLPLTREFGMKRMRITFADVYADPQKYVDSQVAVFREFSTDGVFDLYFMYPEAFCMGCGGLFPDDEPPSVVSGLVNSRADISSIKRIDPAKEPRIKFHLSIVRGLRTAVGADVPIFAHTSAAFKNAVHLRGSAEALLDLYEDPDLMFELLEIGLENALVYAKALKEAGADYILLTNPVASSHMISRAMYEKYSFPFEKKQIAALHGYGLGAFYHYCGNWNDRWDLMAQTGVDIMSLDSPYVGVNMEDAVEKLKGKCVYGNVDVARTMLKGTPEDVYRETATCIEAGKKADGFILGSGCTIPRDTPIGNFAALMDAAQQVGSY
jgi:uroporphyrinogen decarboxylase